MKICVAQTKPVAGDILHNIVQHKKLLELAISSGADTVIFPELSITGYEPELAKDLAVYPDDSRFDDFQQISDERQIIIGMGVPTKSNTGICISMLLFQPGQARQVYSKKYLHPDEEPFFVSGQTTYRLTGGQADIALAICYELSVPEHAEEAFNKGAEIYIASVAKSASGVEKAAKRLAEIARTYNIPVLMSNCTGYCDNFESGGKTAVWNEKGVLVGQLNATAEGILIFDTTTHELIEKTL